jgi:hypothetical protein
MRFAHNTGEHIVHSVLTLFTGYCSATFRYFDRYINKSTYEVQPRRMEGTSTLQVWPFFHPHFPGVPISHHRLRNFSVLTSWDSNLSFPCSISLPSHHQTVATLFLRFYFFFLFSFDRLPRYIPFGTKAEIFTRNPNRGRLGASTIMVASSP